MLCYLSYSFFTLLVHFLDFWYARLINMFSSAHHKYRHNSYVELRRAPAKYLCAHSPSVIIFIAFDIWTAQNAYLIATFSNFIFLLYSLAVFPMLLPFSPAFCTHYSPALFSLYLPFLSLLATSTFTFSLLSLSSITLLW